MTANDPEAATGRWALDGVSLWEFVSARGMVRRQFLQLMVTGGAAAVLAACVGTETPGETPSSSPTAVVAGSNPYAPWFKDPTPFIERDGKGLEASLEYMQGLSRPATISLSATIPSALSWTPMTGGSPWRETSLLSQWS